MVIVGFIIMVPISGVAEPWKSFYINLSAGLVVTGIGIIVVSLFVPAIINSISFRKVREVQENLLKEFEKVLLSWICNFSILLKCPEEFYKPPTKDEKETKEIKPELKEWFVQLGRPGAPSINLKPEQWQVVIANIEGLKWRMTYFKEQLTPLLGSLPEISRILFELNALLDELKIGIPLNQPYVQPNIGSFIQHVVSTRTEHLFKLINYTWEVTGKDK